MLKNYIYIQTSICLHYDDLEVTVDDKSKKLQ